MHPDNPYKEWQGTRRFAKQQLEFRNPYFPKESRHEKTQRHHKLWRYAIGAILLVLVYCTLFTKIFWIDSVEVTGASQEHTERLTRLIETKLSLRHGWIIPGRNSLFFRTEPIVSAIEQDFASELSFETIQVNRDGRVLHINVSERTAQLLWQKNNAELWLLDQSGTVFSQMNLPEGEPLPDLPRLRNLADENTAIGQVAISPAFAQSVLQLHKLLHQRFSEWLIQSYSPKLRECPEETECQASSETEISVEIGESDPSAIYFSTELSLEDQINALGLLLNQKIQSLESVQYVDLRFLPRAFYK